MSPSDESHVSARRRAAIAWSVAALLLIGFAIPWFMWRSSAVVAGLPVWVWWHVGWMLLAALVFWKFSRDAWGIAVEEVETRG